MSEKTTYSDSIGKTEVNGVTMSTTRNSQPHLNEDEGIAQLSASAASSTSESNQNTGDPPVQGTERDRHYSGITDYFVDPNNLQDNNPDITVKIMLPEYFQLLEEGVSRGDSKVSMDSVPDWLDVEKCRRGQRFAMEYYFGIQFAEMLSLMLLFLYPQNLKPLIYTGKSDTPFKAFKRYLSTAVRIKSWYESDIWKKESEARRNLRIVRDLHNLYRNRLCNLDKQILEEKCTLKPPIWSEFSDQLQEDFRSLCPHLQAGTSPFTLIDDPLFISQCDMAGTQFGFIGLMVLYPTAFGAGGASEEDLESFIYLWRCIGYMLGIEDRFNFCAGDLSTVRQRCRDICEFKVKPKLRDVSPTWEHMFRCVVEGISYYVPGVSFEVSLLYLCRVLDVQVPQLEAALTFYQWFMYGITSLVMRYLLRFPPYRALNNWLLKSSIKRAMAHSPEWIRERQERAYPYQAQASRSLCTDL